MAVEKFLGTKDQRWFVGIIVFQAVVVLTMVGITFGIVEADVDTSSTSGYKTLPCYLAIFGLAEIFELLMALDALKLRNVIQLVGILVFHIVLMIFAALQVHEARVALVFKPADECPNRIGCDSPGSLWREVEPFLIVAPCVIAASWLVMIFFVRALFSEFGWAVFYVVGANPALKSMYQWYQIMNCLMKFDFFAFTAVTMQLLIIVLPSNSAEFGLTIAAIPVSLLLLVFCAYAVRREIKWLMTISLILMIAAQTYFYKLVRFYQPASEDQYRTTRATLTTFTIAAFILLFSTFAVGLRCFADFDKGLYTAKNHELSGTFLPSYFFPGAKRQTSYKTGGGVAMTEPRLSIE